MRQVRMLLLSRIATFNGTLDEVLPSATGIADRVGELTDLDVSLWAGGHQAVATRVH